MLAYNLLIINRSGNNRFVNKAKKMRYLITTIEESPFMTELFMPENNFSQGMIVYDLYEDKYMTDGKTWRDIEYDHF